MLFSSRRRKEKSLDKAPDCRDPHKLKKQSHASARGTSARGTSASGDLDQFRLPVLVEPEKQRTSEAHPISSHITVEHCGADPIMVSNSSTG